MAMRGLKPYAELCIVAAARHIGTESVSAQTVKTGQKVVLLRRRWHMQRCDIEFDKTNPRHFMRSETMNDRLRVLQRQPRRISITLSYHVHEALLSRSENEGRSVSNLCAFLLEDALREPQPAALMSSGFDGNGHRLAQAKHLQGTNLNPKGHLRRP